MRVLIAGAGAVGRLVAARMTRAGVECALFGREPGAAARIEASGIALEEEDGSIERVPVRGAGTIAARWDLLAVCVKSYDVPVALAGGVRGLAPAGMVLVLANGLGNLEAAEARWPRARCLAGVLYLGVLRQGADGVRVMGEGALAIGSRAAPAETVLAAVRTFERAGFRAERAQDIDRAIWEKAALNCALNPVAALLGIENGRLPASPAFSAAVRTAAEAAAVARACGVALPDVDWRARLDELCARTAANRCSMLEDLAAGRRTEIDALCGRVAALGAARGIEAPWNACLAALVGAREGEKRSAPHGGA